MIRLQSCSLELPCRDAEEKMVSTYLCRARRYGMESVDDGGKQYTNQQWALLA
jgi:hypothetical protein